MPSVGGVNLLKLLGPSVKAPTESYIETTQPGHDGHELIGEGLRGMRVQNIGLVDIASASSVAGTVRSMIGTFVTVVTREGVTVNNVFVWDASMLEAKKVQSPVGGVNTGEWVVQIGFTLQPM